MWSPLRLLPWSSFEFQRSSEGLAPHAALPDAGLFSLEAPDKLRRPPVWFGLLLILKPLGTIAAHVPPQRVRKLDHQRPRTAKS